MKIRHSKKSRNVDIFMKTSDCCSATSFTIKSPLSSGGFHSKNIVFTHKSNICYRISCVCGKLLEVYTGETVSFDIVIDGMLSVEFSYEPNKMYAKLQGQ